MTIFDQIQYNNKIKINWNIVINKCTRQKNNNCSHKSYFYILQMFYIVYKNNDVWCMFWGPKEPLKYIFVKFMALWRLAVATLYEFTLGTTSSMEVMKELLLDIITWCVVRARPSLFLTNGQCYLGSILMTI